MRDAFASRADANSAPAAGGTDDDRRARTASLRRYRARLAAPDNPGHFLEKTIITADSFRFGKRIVHLANALTNQRIGMEETDDGRWSIYLHSVLLATFDERDYVIQS